MAKMDSGPVTAVELIQEENVGELRGKKQILFGDWLVRRGIITRAQLFRALTLSFQKGFRIGDALVSMRMVKRLKIEEEVQARYKFLSFLR